MLDKPGEITIKGRQGKNRVWKSFLKNKMSKINNAWILVKGNENRFYCNKEENPAQANIIIHLCRGDWTFYRENAGVKSSGWSSQEVKMYKKREKSWSIWIGHLGLLTGTHPTQAPALPHRLEDKGPIFRCRLEQAVNSFGSLELSQNLRWAMVILEISNY